MVAKNVETDIRDPRDRHADMDADRDHRHPGVHPARRRGEESAERSGLRTEWALTGIESVPLGIMFQSPMFICLNHDSRD